MSTFYKVKLQSTAQLGKHTVYDKSVSPWKIERLHVIFEVWSNDDILRTSPCFFVTERMCNGLAKINFSGVSVGDKIAVESSFTFQNLYPGKDIPEYYLLEITGRAFVDDFGIAPPNNLIVSTDALIFLNGYSIVDTAIEEIVK